MLIAKYETFLLEVSKYYEVTNDKVDPEVDGSCGGHFGTYYISCFSFT